MSVRSLRGAVSALALLALMAVVLSGCGSSAPSLAGYPNGDLFNTRFTGGPINRATVARLTVAWQLPLTSSSQYGSYSSSPVVVGGVVYSQDLRSNVEALDLRSGRVLWRQGFESPDQGPNGVVVAQGRVFGTTATAAFALDAKTGAKRWSVRLVRNAREGIDMAPGFHDGIVYVSTVPGNNRFFYGGGAAGVLWALKASDGSRLWHFDTAPEIGRPGANSLVNSGGGLWYTPAFDKHGSMYFGTGNPGPFPGAEGAPWGSSRPGRNLYTDSLVKLDAKTGELRWYYQLTPHDIYDHDLQDPPILADAGGRQLAIEAGKAGVVIAVDRRTGALVWKRAVGIHNGHDHDSIYALKHEFSRLHIPETVFPGALGGVIAPMASNGRTIFAPVVNSPAIYTSQTARHEGRGGHGELVALDAATGDVRWARQFDAPPYGAATAVNDLVFATTYDGTLYALAADSGSEVWKTQLPAGTNTGVVVHGDELLAAAGVATKPGEHANLVAFRLNAAHGPAGAGAVSGGSASDGT